MGGARDAPSRAMMRRPGDHLTSILAALVSTPVEVQMSLDAHWDHAVMLWQDAVARLVEAAPEVDRAEVVGLLSGAAPVRQVLTDYELECSVRVRLDRERSAALWIRPIDLGWETVSRDSRRSA